VEERQLEPADIEQVTAMWHTWFGDVPWAIFPGTSFLDWVAHFENFATSVIVIDGEPGGFVRYHLDDPDKIRFFLTKDKESTVQVLGYLNQKFNRPDWQTLQIPVHPVAAVTKNWLPGPYASKVETWEAGMIKIFAEENQSIRTYCDQVLADQQRAGIVIYPPYLDEAW
jgi:hypothetical protein